MYRSCSLFLDNLEAPLKLTEIRKSIIAIYFKENLTSKENEHLAHDLTASIGAWMHVGSLEHT